MAAPVTGTEPFRAALAVVRFALETCAECGREGHDLPRMGLDAAESALGRDHDAVAHARGYWGELYAFEPTRPQEMPGADAETRAATVALTRAIRLCCMFPEWKHNAMAWGMRTAIGDAAEALVACGWTHEHAWREVMERFTASCPEVEL